MIGDNVLLKQFYDIKSMGVDMNDHAWVRASAKNRGLNAIAGLTKREYQALVRRASQMNLRTCPFCQGDVIVFWKGIYCPACQVEWADEEDMNADRMAKMRGSCSVTNDQEEQE